MEKQQLDKIAQAWIKTRQSEYGSSEIKFDTPEYEKVFLESQPLFDMIYDNPEDAWIVIQAIRQATDETHLLAHLAADSLEYLLVKHGKKFIDRFEALAKMDEVFRGMLGEVKRQDMPDDLWDRVQAIALPLKWD